MNYVALLAATVRLLDLHDSDRGYGESPNFTREARTGHPDGVYVDVAAMVIDCLKQQDEAAYQEYLSFSAIVAHVRATRPDVEESDVAYVIAVLRRPTELFYISREAGFVECHSEKRKTALVEKTDYADEYRLSATGRMLPALANTARDATYVRGDAYNLLHAVEGGDFQKIPQFTDEIIAQLRTEILNVHAAMEKIGRVEAVKNYVDRFDQWKNIIADTIRIVSRAEEQLDTSAFRENLDVWLDKSGSRITFASLYNGILRIRQVLTTFNRLLAELVQTAMKERRNAITPPSFKEFAAELVRNPFAQVAEDHFFRQWSPVKLETPFHSVFDGAGAVAVRELPEKATAVSFSGEEIEPASTVGRLRFLDCRGKEIAERLRAGPMLLSSAIADGLFLVEDDALIGDLVGVFVTPDALDAEGIIEIRINPDLTLTQIGQDDYLFTDLELRLTEDA